MVYFLKYEAIRNGEAGLVQVSHVTRNMNTHYLFHTPIGHYYWAKTTFYSYVNNNSVREAATICPRPCKLIFDLLTLKVVSESRVTSATSVPILVFLGLSVLDLGPMYATNRRQTDARRASSLNTSYPRGRHNNAVASPFVTPNRLQGHGAHGCSIFNQNAGNAVTYKDVIVRLSILSVNLLLSQCYVALNNVLVRH